jgi:hypothetical protein
MEFNAHIIAYRTQIRLAGACAALANLTELRNRTTTLLATVGELKNAVAKLVCGIDPAHGENNAHVVAYLSQPQEVQYVGRIGQGTKLHPLLVTRLSSGAVSIDGWICNCPGTQRGTARLTWHGPGVRTCRQ